MNRSIEQVRRRYAEAVCAEIARADRQRIVDAYGAIAREDFLPQPPWHLGGGRAAILGRFGGTDDPRDLYDDLLVVISEARRINNGQPSLWARMMDLVVDWDRVKSVLHLGCGMGYYTAIMAKLFSAATVEYFEIEADLMAASRANLAGFTNVRERQAGSKYDAIFLSYGICTLGAELIESLNDSGVIITPVTDLHGMGRVVRFARSGNSLMAEPSMPVAFITDSSDKSFPSHMPVGEAVIAIESGKDIVLAEAFRSKA